ncbi:MAG: hypothetical protein M3R55_02150 [Acidobacteriota bacterium]|nr:hypothetical protein [Acidobacteriota bacterium]
MLLTAEDARTALGVEAKRTNPDNMSGMSMCQYMVGETSESVTLQFRPAAPADFDRYIKQSVEAFSVTATPIDGVGERAVLAGEQFVFLSKGHMYVLMLGKHLPVADKTERLRRLASVVLSRA